MLKAMSIMLGTATIAAQAVPASAEILNVPFTNPSTESTGLYSGTVDVTVSGTGFSYYNYLNDAFYFTGGTYQDASALGSPPSDNPNTNGYYQLGFGTSPLTGDPSSAVVNDLGMRPTYNNNNAYSFKLNVGPTPTHLYFGVTDQNFTDNGGNGYTVNIGAVPEPATWAMMMVGFGMIGFGLRRRNKVATTVRFA